MRPSDNGGNESKEARKRRLYESRREREFYSYFESVLAYASKEPKFCDLCNPLAAASHRATSSSDKTLTSFAQLAALRIGTRRAMIFFFDSDHAYVFAESTRTTSLQDGSHHAPGDSLWLGFTKIPRGLSVCEVTANLPANEGSNAQDPDTSSIAHIINDLTEDTRFCDRPYVLDGPKARFYAGVPITTLKGINIGALCVLDDKPRDGLELSEVDFMSGLASTIMSHLELVRSKEDNQRSRDMNTALGAFIEGKSDSRDWWHSSGHASIDAQGHPASGLGEARLNTTSNRVPTTPRAADQEMENTLLNEYFASDSSLGTTEVSADSIAGKSPTYDLPTPNKQSRMETAVSFRQKSGLRSGYDGSASSGMPSHTRDDESEEDLSARVKATTTRAAGLIQKGVCADGVLFLDATIGSFGGLISGAQGLSQTETETDASHPSDTGNFKPPENHQEKQPSPTVRLSEPPKHSIVLGSAYSSDIESQVTEAMQEAKFPGKVLRSLLRRYPDGQVWHFNADGDASDEDENVSDEYLSSTSAGESGGSELEHTTTPSSRRAAQKRRARKRDGRAIQDIFPGIRSFMFLGMWDPHQERWFGASVVLSYSSTRMFSIRNELSYVAAFCDVVLGEIWRLEAQELGRSKNNFISSISHELRSPLHGILGSAECLEEGGQEQSALSNELIRSIISCGTTLLDVINDLLEYSRINHGPQKQRGKSPSKTSNLAPGESTAGKTSELELGVMVSTLTEEAVNAACLGFDHRSIKPRGTSGSGDEHPALLSLNIEEPQNTDWLFHLASGSWKRICMNLVLNALKYTPCGYVGVSLRKKWLQKRVGRGQAALVELVVEDSGIGMSDEFQVKNLFRPFKQENKLTPGTGLGLNLVSQIVKSQAGTVHVRSSKGVGTTVRVSLPLRRPSSGPTTTMSTTLMRAETSSASVRFIGFGAIPTESTTKSLKSNADERLLSSLDRCCKDFGLSVCGTGTDDALDNHASVHVVREQELERLSHTSDEDAQRSFFSTDGLKPVIVICTTRESAFKLRSTPIAASLPVTTQYLWLPIGPVKLAGALSTCRMYFEQATFDDEVIEQGKTDLQLVNQIAGTQFSKAPLHSTQPSSMLGKEAGISAHILPSVIEGQAAGDGSKDGTSSTVDTIDFAVAHKDFQVSQPSLYERSRSNAATRPSTPSIRKQTTIDRAMTAPYQSARALSLLLVDDNAINLRLLEVFASKAGHMYRTAQNGQEALEVYEGAARTVHHRDDSLEKSVRLDGKPEVVLMDINMPVMNGFEAARAIRRFEKASGSPRATIIALTGLGDKTAQEQSFMSGMDWFLTKPVKMKALAGLLTKLQGIDG